MSQDANNSGSNGMFVLAFCRGWTVMLELLTATFTRLALHNKARALLPSDTALH